jgi:3-deoxy-D-manno-octulosonic-acid transferase
VIAPRRRERVAEVVRGCRERGLDVALRTEGGAAPVLVLDTMGELARAYNGAAAAYVGGGLTPAVGLHNLIEPLVCGVPLLFGPCHGKAARIAEEVLRHGAGLEVRDGAALLAALRTAIGDAATKERLAAAAARMLARHRGAAERQARRIRELVA